MFQFFLEKRKSYGVKTQLCFHWALNGLRTAYPRFKHLYLESNSCCMKTARHYGFNTRIEDFFTVAIQDLVSVV